MEIQMGGWGGGGSLNLEILGGGGSSSFGNPGGWGGAGGSKNHTFCRGS